MLENIIGLFLFIISIYGYILLGNKRYKIELEYLPIIIFSSIGCVIFISGILNIMNIAFMVLFIIGMVLTICYKIKKNKLKFSAGFLFGLLIVAYLFVYLYEAKYTRYDNFSHWGLIVKNIWMNSRFPNFQDEIIMFQSYPPGSACFIWYVCKIVGYSEGIALFAHRILIVSCILPFFVLCNQVMEARKKRFLMLVVAVECIIWTTYGTNRANELNSLLVDVLLASVAIAAFTMVYYYRNELEKALFISIPLVTYEVCIKNSGMIWTIAIFIELIYFSIVSKGDNKQRLSILGGTIGIPLAFKILWDKHVGLVFSDGSASKHAMSAENWSKVLNEKTQEDLELISQIFFERVFSIKNKYMILLCIIFLLTILLFIVNKEMAKQLHIIFGCIFLFVVTIVYQIGNYCMYIFSMPKVEAMSLASYDRYVMTLECFLIGILSMFLLEFWVLCGIEANKNYIYGFCVSIILVIGLVISEKENIKDLFNNIRMKTGTNITVRLQLEDIIQKYELEDRKKSIIYVNNKASGYKNYMSKYLLYSNDIRIIDKEQINELKNADEYDYAIFWEKDDVANNWLANTKIPFENQECLKMENYKYITLQEYLLSLKNESYISFISVKDDASMAYTDGMKRAMNELGLKEDLIDKFRYSYGAIIDGNKVIYENLTDKLIDISGECSGVNYSLKSAGMNCGNLSSITINGEEFSLDNRGINIVVYDKAKKQVVDSINFDTWQVDGTYIIKE